MRLVQCCHPNFFVQGCAWCNRCVMCDDAPAVRRFQVHIGGEDMDFLRVAIAAFDLFDDVMNRHHEILRYMQLHRANQYTALLENRLPGCANRCVAY